MTAVTIHSDLEPKKINSVTVSIASPSVCHEMIELNAIILDFFLMLRFKPAFSLLSRGSLAPLHFSSVKVVSSAYLRLLIFLLAVLIPACDSSSLAFHVMYSTNKLNKQGDDIQPCCTPFPTLNQSVVPCLVLTVAFLTHPVFLGDR